jgi:predicted RNA-binding Zn-ribbon protein involved in translation (DUF1610 family)
MPAARRSYSYSDPDTATETEADVATEETPTYLDFYCPGCGRQYEYRQRCTGSLEQPHPPIEVVSTDELKSGDPSQHTAAPGVQG